MLASLEARVQALSWRKGEALLRAEMAEMAVAFAGFFAAPDASRAGAAISTHGAMNLPTGLSAAAIAQDIPVGRSYPRVDLHLDSKATIRFTRDQSKYPMVFTRWEGMELMNFSPCAPRCG